MPSIFTQNTAGQSQSFGMGSGSNQQYRNRDYAPDTVLGYVMQKVENGRNDRDTRYASRWQEYTRLWRGFYSEQDKNRESERSKLISPALQQAVEMTTAEIEESIFSKDAWFGVENDTLDADEETRAARDRLLKDFRDNGVESEVANTFSLGTIYGTGIAKLNVEESEERTIEDGKVVVKRTPSVRLYCIRPDEFIIDPGARTLGEAGWCATDTTKPLSGIEEKIAQGIYMEPEEGDTLEAWTGVVRSSTTGTGMDKTFSEEDAVVLITEFCGKLPREFFDEDDLSQMHMGKDMIEGFVTIANEGIVLRARPNPFLMQDWPYIVYQHETVPGEIWGRGVCEKGFNPQKALDAEMRARMDALALLIAPMMGADINRLGRNADNLAVRPGGVVLTRGRPSEVYEPLAFGDPTRLGGSFQQTSDLERMVQMATGAMDSASPLASARRNETSGGMSQINAGAMKRNKRTLKNIERDFLNPLIKKALWRYAQFDQRRYPTVHNFSVNVGLGIMAKEVENSQLAQMVGFLPDGSPAQKIITKAIFDNTTSAEKKALQEAMEEFTRPPTEEEQQAAAEQQRMQQEAAKIALEQTRADVEKTRAETEKLKAEAEHKKVVADLEDEKIAIQAANATTAAEKIHVTRETNQINKRRNELDAQTKRLKAVGSN